MGREDANQGWGLFIIQMVRGGTKQGGGFEERGANETTPLYHIQ